MIFGEQTWCLLEAIQLNFPQGRIGYLDMIQVAGNWVECWGPSSISLTFLVIMYRSIEQKIQVSYDCVPTKYLVQPKYRFNCYLFPCLEIIIFALLLRTKCPIWAYQTNTEVPELLFDLVACLYFLCFTESRSAISEQFARVGWCLMVTVFIVDPPVFWLCERTFCLARHFSLLDALS